MLGLKLNHVSKRDPCRIRVTVKHRKVRIVCIILEVYFIFNASNRISFSKSIDIRFYIIPIKTKHYSTKIAFDIVCHIRSYLLRLQTVKCIKDIIPFLDLTCLCYICFHGAPGGTKLYIRYLSAWLTDLELPFNATSEAEVEQSFGANR